MLNKKLRRTSLAILVVVLMLSVFAMNVFAEEANGLLISPNPVADEAVSADNAAQDASEETAAAEDAADAETVLPSDEKTEEQEEEAADTTTTGAEDEHAGHDHGDEEKKEDEGFTTSDLVLLIIFGVVVIVVAIVCIIKRERVGKFFRGLKSEFKKIVWSPWNQVRKNTIVVIVVVIALAAVIGLLDYLFGNGITELKNLINP